MSFTVHFYHHAKKLNSTKRPSGDGTVFNVNLKSPCSINKPVMMISASSFNFNYAKWNDTYFFITDVVSAANSLWEVSMEVDTLATFKESIQAATLYCTRSPYGPNNAIDRLYEVGDDIEKSSAFAAIDFLGNALAVSYVIRAVSNQGGVGGLTCAFATTRAALGELGDFLFTYDYAAPGNIIQVPYQLLASGVDGAGDLVHEIVEATRDEFKLKFGDLFDCIAGVKIIPIPLAQVPGVSGSLKLGDIDTGVSGKVMTSQLATASLSITVPGFIHGNFETYPPYKEYEIYLPFVGVVNLPVDRLSSNIVNIYFALDMLSGDCQYDIFDVNIHNPIATHTANCGVDVPIASYTSGTAAAVSGMVGGAVKAGLGVASTVATAGVSAAIGGSTETIASGIGTLADALVQSFQANAQYRGSQGGIAALNAVGANQGVVVICNARKPITSLPAIRSSYSNADGGMRTLSAPGFYVCNAPSIAISGHADECATINQLLSKGVFIE